MNFGEIQTEVYARGFSHLSSTSANQTRVKAWINSAYQGICALERWPFLEATSTGAAPLTISDLGAIKSVLETGENKSLVGRNAAQLTKIYGDITLVGSPTFYYQDGATTIRTYPVGGTLSVKYWKVPADLSGDSDSLLIPAKYHQTVVDWAVWRAYVDNDEFAVAKEMRDIVDRQVEAMRTDLLWNDHFTAKSIWPTASGDW